METIVKWRQDKLQQPCFDINTPQIPLVKPIWYTLEECIDVDLLMAGKVPIIIKEGGSYKTNNKDVYDQYRNSGKRIEMAIK